jgi:hypothetical protein
MAYSDLGKFSDAHEDSRFLRGNGIGLGCAGAGPQLFGRIAGRLVQRGGYGDDLQHHEFLTYTYGIYESHDDGNTWTMIGQYRDNVFS